MVGQVVLRAPVANLGIEACASLGRSCPYRARYDASRPRAKLVSSRFAKTARLRGHRSSLLRVGPFLGCPAPPRNDRFDFPCFRKRACWNYDSAGIEGAAAVSRKANLARGRKTLTVDFGRIETIFRDRASYALAESRPRYLSLRPSATKPRFAPSRAEEVPPSSEHCSNR